MVVSVGSATAGSRSQSPVMPSALFHLFLIIFFHKIKAFPNEVAKETLGGLISDEVVLRGRQSIDDATREQLSNPVIISNTTDISIACPTANLTFVQSDVKLTNVACNLTYYRIATPLVISFETDVQEIARLIPPFWIYLNPMKEDDANVTIVPFNLSIIGLRMGSTYLKVWIREGKRGGGPGATFYEFNRNNQSQVKTYYSWVVNATIDNDVSLMGFQLKVLRPRGKLELAFRIVIIILVCGITFLMGCELDGRLIWQHMKKPVGPLIGFICQFGLMPLVSFFASFVKFV